MTERGVLALFLWFGAALFVARAQAYEARPDFVVLIHGDAFELNELAELANGVTAELRRAGQSLLLQPTAALEARESRDMRRLDSAQLRTLGDEMRRARETRDSNRLLELAGLILDAAARAPEATIDDAEAMHETARYIITQACFEGIRAYAELGMPAAGRRLVDACASLTWLVAHDRLVRPDVRSPLLREVRQYDLEVSTIPVDRKVWLQGAEIPANTVHRVRTIPGARLPVVVDCGNARRVHWVRATSGASKLRLSVKCEFDAALHADTRGIWLTSTIPNLREHALEIARVLDSPRVLVVGKRDSGFVLQEISVADARGVVVSVPFVHSDRQLAAAIDEVLRSSSAVSTSSSFAEANRRLSDSRRRSDKRKLWAGGRDVRFRRRRSTGGLDALSRALRRCARNLR